MERQSHAERAKRLMAPARGTLMNPMVQPYASSEPGVNNAHGETIAAATRRPDIYLLLKQELYTLQDHLAHVVIHRCRSG